MKEKAAVFRENRKQKWALSTESCWEALESRDFTHGVLALHGIGSENGFPYAFPINFAADRTSARILFHTTMDANSHKLAAIVENPHACFTATGQDCHYLLPPHDATTGTVKPLAPCGVSMAFTSVIARGDVSEIIGEVNKRDALALLTVQKVNAGPWGEIPLEKIARTRVFAITVVHISGVTKR